MKNRKNVEYENFDRVMAHILKVSHSEIKAKLDAGKKTKKKRSGPRKVAKP